MAGWEYHGPLSSRRAQAQDYLRGLGEALARQCTVWKLMRPKAKWPCSCSKDFPPRKSPYYKIVASCRNPRLGFIRSDLPITA